MVKQIEFLEHIKDEVLQYTSSLRFNKSNHQNLYSIALYGSILELTSACIILIKEDIPIAVPILFRSILEAHVDLTNLCNDASYSLNMEAIDLKEWIRILGEAGEEQNPYLASISQLKDRNNVLITWEKDLKDLRTNGHNPLDVLARFSKAGMEKQYRSIYNMVSSHAHNNIRSLIDRHINIQDGTFSVNYFKSKDSSYLIDSLSGTLIDASCKLHKLLDSPLLSKLEELWGKLTKLRQDLGLCKSN